MLNIEGIGVLSIVDRILNIEEKMFRFPSDNRLGKTNFPREYVVPPSVVATGPLLNWWV